MTESRGPSSTDRAKKASDLGKLSSISGQTAPQTKRGRSKIAAEDGPELSPLPPRSAQAETPESCLLRALRASTTEERELYARRGLSRARDDEELTALLLRQLYLVHLDRLEYEEALQVAEEMIESGELGDIARQDAARVAVGLGRLEEAASHLRIAARICPLDRRSFHWGTLGALLRFNGHPKEAIDAFKRATRWAQRDRALYRAQQILAEQEAALPLSADLARLRESLESSETQRGYTLWVLGELCVLLGDRAAGREYLTRFLSRTAGSSSAKSLALRGEIAHAEELLHKLSA